LYTSRSGYSRWGASWRHKVGYGATNAHSSSLIVLGYGLRFARGRFRIDGSEESPYERRMRASVHNTF
jgi:hypothetical protein